ncbi:hypothetical protein [Cryobacterium tagatosivorans]|uniref:Uncharacterized protein n=1 Tax=Cryobacterium tagatosivorans TaxID=1259199 RepID=A0A4R8UD97_9MICO|nr:hypothetical protein [Cryobacterium tagatosivorans]TFB48187.1 hypothetical protein E3O23_14195 [Cryobacterium tagatosivorans]
MLVVPLVLPLVLLVLVLLVLLGDNSQLWPHASPRERRVQPQLVVIARPAVGARSHCGRRAANTGTDGDSGPLSPVLKHASAIHPVLATGGASRQALATPAAPAGDSATDAVGGASRATSAAGYSGDNSQL